MQLQDNHLALAREALGLPNTSSTACRNEHVPSDVETYEDWLDMVDLGLADRDVVERNGVRLDRFKLTRHGATCAVEPFERLPDAHFPAPPMSLVA